MTENNPTPSSTAIQLRLGTRQSPLAMAQAEEARRRLCAAHGWEEGAVELVPVVASGDKIQDRALAEIGGKALWTRELDIWLDEGRIDAAVHSMKDVETIRPPRLVIAAILPRADRRDVLVGASSIAAIPHGAKIGTSAPRRAAQMLNLRPDCEVVLFRGNVATRLAKLAAGEADVTLLAAAGLERLGETDTGAALDLDEFLSAPAQGAIGLECRADDTRTLKLLSAIDHETSHTEILTERALLSALEGSCHSPIAASAVKNIDGRVNLRAVIFSPDGSDRVAGEVAFAASLSDPVGPVADFAADLLKRAKPATRAVFGQMQ
ncbi:Hydroxymethylbilane synthase [Alteripontixanthobacter maritimus]|uniref:Porphobilinogen deaminase n=1 Tax=Alteripontixanthobacter maritimus TaxID=2161824 RepID=A0A369Q7H5_9SPHN|nr:hydroxymethylbilane synthase [Alteripontixanthobacter maritimus]RDC59485.1 Hydroxymethylbilane synthase [Alteripontixanthobacter maritimus]